MSLYNETYLSKMGIKQISNRVFSQALFPGDLLNIESKLDGDFFFTKISPRSGDDRSGLKGTNIGFEGVAIGFVGLPCRGFGEWTGGEDVYEGDVEVLLIELV